MIIYKTTNLINGKIYIGKDSKNKPSYYGSGILLKLAIKKYGKNNFRKETIEQCKNIEELNEREIYWIEFYKSSIGNLCYNIGDGGIGGNNNLKDNPNYEALKLMYTNILKEKARPNIPRGEKHHNYGKKSGSSGTKWSDEQKKNLKDSLKKSEIFNNSIHSKERAEKISKTQKGKPKSKEFVDKYLKGSNNPMYGKKLTIEHKKKISDSIKSSERFQKAMKSEERNKKISESQKGKVVSKETRQKLKGINNPMFGKTHTEENKLKMSFPLGNNPRAKTVVLENLNNNEIMEFDCIKSLSFFLNKPRTTINMWLKKFPKKEIEKNLFIYYKNGDK